MKHQKLLRIIYYVVVIAVIISNLTFIIIQNKQKYFSFDFWHRFPTLKQMYLDSQYANKHPKAWIADEEANSYAAGAYVKGVSPILIAADTPPLGRYFIGLSAILFNNECIQNIFFGFLSLFLLYLLGKQVFSSSVLALLPPLFTSFEPLFRNQFAFTPLLDIMQLVFLLGAFLTFNKGFVRKKPLWYFVAANILLGFFVSTKFFMSGITIVAAWYTVLLLHKDKKRIIALTLTLPLSIVTLLASYTMVLVNGENVKSFLGIQKWVFLYHKSQLVLPFSLWALLLFNKWYVWWGNTPVLSDKQWQLSWPVITVLSLLTAILYVRRKIKHKKELEVLLAWIVFYLLFFSFGNISVRYFVILIPVMYIVALYGVVQLYQRYQKKQINKRR